jgi:DNA polymerase-3 subunit gamma/tau
VQTLRNAVATDRVAHAYLFAGPRGTGKTTTARLLAKAVNCLETDLSQRPCDQCDPCQAVMQGRFLDLIEIDAASNTSVEDVRDLRDKINFSPNQGRYKVYIIDEVHMLSTAAFNALLKTLEEPPSHAIFILATTEIHKIPATVLSRCQQHEFRRIPVNDIVAHLKAIAEIEGLQVEAAALGMVARQATGSLRDAISLLDQLASSGEVITLELAQNVLGTATNQAVIDIVESILAESTSAGLEHLHRALDAGSDPHQFARQIVDYLRDLLLIHMGNVEQVDATVDVRALMANHAQRIETAELVRMIRIFNQAASDSRSAWQPCLPLELAFIEALSASQPVERAAPSAGQASSTRTKPPRSTTPEDQTKQNAPGAMPVSEAQSKDSEGVELLTVINENWRQILALVNRQSPNTAALLRSGRLLGVKDGVLYFGLSEVLKSKMEKSENILVVQDAIKQVLSSEVQFRCVVSSGKSGGLPPNIDGEGMVASALRDLGGEIVDIQ